MIYAVCAILAAAAALIYDQLWLRRVMNRLNRMLDHAVAGSFTPSRYDESRLSAIECRLLQYLSACETSAGQLAAQRAQIQRLIADISHQTKTPVANLVLYAGLLADQPLTPECRDCVNAISAQANKLQFLLDSLLKAGRLETGVIAVQPRPAGTGGLVSSAVRAAAPAAERKGVSLSCRPVEAAACFDPKWTREALDNLIDNAVKYTPAGGSVTVSVTPYELFCRIDVADTGIGIPEEEQGHIFERFYRAAGTRDAEGVGLGLFLAREIAAAQGGYIRVSSAPGRGSTFSLFLPRA